MFQHLDESCSCFLTTWDLADFFFCIYTLLITLGDNVTLKLNVFFPSPSLFLVTLVCSIIVTGCITWYWL